MSIVFLNNVTFSRFNKLKLIYFHVFLIIKSYYREEVARELKSALSSIKLSDRGVYVQASTLGSLEALLEFLKASKIPVSQH